MERESSAVSEPVPFGVSRGLGRPYATTYRGIERRAPTRTPGTRQENMIATPSTEVVVRQPVVWLVNEGGHAYTKAERFGRLLPLTQGNVNHFNLDRLMVSVGPKLQSAHEDDYLLISGSPILNGLIVSMWLAKFQKANLLQWSTRADGYVHITLHRDAVNRMANSSLDRAS
jgi:hypothetical protein